MRIILTGLPPPSISMMLSYQRFTTMNLSYAILSTGCHIYRQMNCLQHRTSRNGNH